MNNILFTRLLNCNLKSDGQRLSVDGVEHLMKKMAYFYELFKHENKISNKTSQLVIFPKVKF
jgi:hypothetical protein